MQKDFYLNDRSLAGYVEKDWFDHILTSNKRKPMFEFAPFEARTRYSNYHEQLVEFLASALSREGSQPRRMLEVGSALGRTLFEVGKRIEFVRSATLIEPSLNLFSVFKRIFEREVEGGVVRKPADEGAGEVEGLTTVSILKGNLELDEVLFDMRPIQAACSKIDISSFNLPFQKMTQDLGLFDLVICSNVIDQCEDHFQLVEFLQRSTAPGGILVLSCTYQWQDKYIGNAPVKIKDINELFSAEWKLLGETNLPFEIRTSERHWMGFLSHAVIYQRL